MPTVSVILLAWNAGKYLKPAVESILNQSMRDFELLLVDNDSRDGSVDAVLADMPDPRVRLIRHPVNLGIAAGTALAIPLCRSPWIAIMDHDDRSHRMRLELQLAAAAADPSLDIIGTAMELIDADDRTIGTWPAFYDPAEIRRYVTYNMPLNHATLMGRAEVFAAFPYRGQFEMVTDFDFLVRASDRFKIGAVSLPLYQYRRHAGSTITSRFTETEILSAVVRLCTARRRAGRPERVDETVAEARGLLAGNLALGEMYAHFGRLCFAEKFYLLAAFHAALDIRTLRSTWSKLRYFRYVLAALRSEPGSAQAAIAAMGKAPFWILLQRSGFPAFPRY